jgi:arylsulfatase A-like enzyme
LPKGGIRFPFIKKWRDSLPTGELFHHPVIALGLMPTFLELGGLDETGSEKFNGVSLPFFKEKK